MSDDTEPNSPSPDPGEGQGDEEQGESGQGSALHEVRLERVVLYDGADRQHLVLRERRGDRSFPIVIGSFEAGEIQRVVSGVESERPLTHRLLVDTLRTLGAQLVSVNIVALARGTFYARLDLEGPDGTRLEVDARPSDAIALAMRTACPIRVAESVLRNAAPPANGEA